MSEGKKIIILFCILITALSVLWIWYARQNNERAVWTPQKETATGVSIFSLTKPAILVSDPVQGQPNAPLTIVEFADFRCPHCVETAEQLKKLMMDNPGKIRLVWKDFPIIPPREESLKAHEAARCAQMQGKFWEYHDALFNNQNNLTPAQLIVFAQQIDLQTDKFNECLNNETTKSLVERSFAEGQNLGVDGTPTIYVNGKKWEKSIVEINSLIK